MRNAFARGLVAAALADERVVLLTGDHGYSLFDEFRHVCPKQYLNAGVAEQNMVGVAAGLAKAGLRPWVYGLSAFVPVRVLEQIKLDVCYEGLPVIFVGDGAGVVYSALGASHQSTEDVAALRVLPQMGILSPADAHEMAACMALAAAARGPVYLRMGKSDLGAVHAAPPALDWGRWCRVQAGEGPLVWIATGSMVKTALAVAPAWPESEVWSASCLKPIDVAAVREACLRHQAVIVLEEHSIHGGLGSAVAEVACAEAPTFVCRVGIRDRFSQFCGSYDYLMREHQLDPQSVAAQVREFVGRLPARSVDFRSAKDRPFAERKPRRVGQAQRRPTSDTGGPALRLSHPTNPCEFGDGTTTPRNPPESMAQALHDQILALVRDYHHARHATGPFVPGESKVHYAGRVFDERELVAAVDSVLDLWLTLGPQGDAFERELAEIVGVKHALIVNSGSSANLVAMATLTSSQLDRPLAPGDEVLTVAAGFPTTVAPIVQHGCVPVFVDVALETANVLVDRLAEAVGPKTRAIVLAHALGNPFDVDG
ncbi:MAG TPA: DegT/DnrJ/EryC1/StrS family aminotransferase, partial [Pirellulales bacterium]|nr:DegT/DnrJ/EryC1/StrS family aminotransferase [Pirellulales bacterium]